MLLFAVGLLALIPARAESQDRVGFWNGYLSQNNIVECVNDSAAPVQVTITVFDRSGKTLNTIPARIPALGTEHFALQGNDIVDRFGTYTVRQTGGAQGNVHCYSLFYRGAPRGAGELLDYAYTLPTQAALRGFSAGTYNSMNPDVAAGPVFNWFTIYNPNDQAQTFSVSIYSANGDAHPTKAVGQVRLEAKERRDFALGHDTGQEVGLYTITPTDSSKPYYAYLVRYGIGTGRFNFAFPLIARSAVCDSGLVPASTMDPATNWAEIANPYSTPVAVKVDVYAASGRLVKSISDTVQPFAQRHIYLNEYLGSRATGSYRVQCTQQNARGFLTQSLFYGHRTQGSSAVEWAYASQPFATPPADQCLSVPVNTHIGAANWLNVVNQAAHGSTVQSALRDASGAYVSDLEGPHTLARGLRKDLSVNAELGQDIIGVGMVSGTGAIRSELLRVYYRQDGAIGTILNMPAQSTKCSLTQTESHSTPVVNNPHATGHGEHIPASDLPKGVAGSSEVRIRSTSVPVKAPNPQSAFRTVCDLSHYAYDDPIVFPNQPGRSHLHVFFGNTGANAFSTAESLRNSGNSTCRGGIANRSAYWVPAVIDARGVPIRSSGALFYYKSQVGGDRTKIQNIPPGLRMIAGDATANPGKLQNNYHYYWGCEGRFTGQHRTIAETPCTAGEKLEMHITFPSCWNGQLDSADHTSHMAYPQNSSCPASHPRELPVISFHVSFPIPANDTRGEYRNWRLVSDGYEVNRNGGLSLHADWFNGWDPQISQTWTRNCLNANVDCAGGLLGDGRTIY
ncbi:MAG: DUF1996 domain-containing protein [Bdellovibrionales bacterium]|nr:DUF1996 domain-containing protein [Bdellovibrionales bacterium]